MRREVKEEWLYQDFTNVAGVTVGDISGRRLIPSPGAPYQGFSFYFDAGDTGRQYHLERTVMDTTWLYDRTYRFETDGASPFLGLLKTYRERAIPGWIVLGRTDTTWAQDAAGNPYVAEVLTTLDEGTGNEKQSKVTQVVNAWGNVTEKKTYNFGNLTTPARVQTYTYAASPCQDRNRLASAQVGGTTLFTISYDEAGALVDAPNMPLHDAAWGLGYTCRGNATRVVSYVGQTVTRTFRHNIGGQVTWSSDGVTQLDVEQNANYSAPARMTPNSNANLATSMTWTSFLGLATETGPNNATAAFTYDVLARPASVSSPHGAVYLYNYTLSPPTVTVGWASWAKRTTQDGLGRSVKEEMLAGSMVVSIRETEYGLCACSPMGRVKRVSEPYIPGGTPVWTTYNYDARGRVTSVVAPDGAATAYSYAGNTVTVTDPKGRWKKTTFDVFGNIVQVNEPNPGGGADLVTTYQYNGFDKLTTVTMTRGAVTQTRTFVYDSAQRLVSKTEPETGTTTLEYDVYGRLIRKTDAKGQVLQNTYDSYGRVVQAGLATLYWDYGGENTWGRVAAIDHGGGYWEALDYTPGGLVKAKTLIAGEEMQQQVTAEFDYDGEGRMRKVVLPPAWYKDMYGNWGAQPLGRYETQYDPLGRPQTLKYTAPQDLYWFNMAQNAIYDAGGRLLSMDRPWSVVYTQNPTGTSHRPHSAELRQETRQYNGRGQMTRQTFNTFDIQYIFPSVNNDGRLERRVFAGPGVSEDVSYTYDVLGRLTRAETAGPEWGQSFVFDGFGNLTQKNVVKGSAPAMSLTISGATNRITTSGFAYDLNGNLTQSPFGTYAYDAANRLVRAESGAGVEEYGYAANNRRLWKKKTDGTVEVYFYLPDGRLLATYRKVVTGATYCLAWPKERVWFGGMVLAAEQVAVYTDRLGSVVSRSGITQRYYPHGEGFAGNWAEAGLAFATYERAQHAGLDQAWNRGYLATYGRFAQADPYEASGGAGEPGSWNRYGYVGGDPVNYRDLKGLARCKVIEDRDAAAGWVAVLECESGGGTVQRRQAIEMEGQRPDPREILKYAQETLGAEVDREEIETYVDPIVRLARVAFAFEDCVRLFSGTNVISPVAALRRVRYSFGQIISMVGSPRSAETKGEGLRPSWWPLGVYYNQAHIRFDIGQWLAGGTRFRLTTFIHELGHAVHYLSVGGITGGFVHDDSAIDVNRENDRLITERCVNPIASAID